MEKYFNNLYRLLFETDSIFIEIKDSPKISQGLFTLIWVNIFLYTLRYVFTGEILNVFLYLFTLICFLTSVLFSWFMLGLFFEYIAKIFEKSGNLKKILYLSSFTVLPWLLLAPLELLKEAGNIGYFFGVFFELIVYFWTIFLYCKSLQHSYDLKFSRSVMLIFLPFIAMFFAFFGGIGFFTKLGYIFTV